LKSAVHELEVPVEKNNSNDSSFTQSSSVVDREDKEDELHRLRMINSEIEENNSKMIAEIENVKNICNSPAFENKDVDIYGIDEKFSKF
jgi:hypothetical protein